MKNRQYGFQHKMSSDALELNKMAIWPKTHSTDSMASEMTSVGLSSRKISLLLGAG